MKPKELTDLNETISETQPLEAVSIIFAEFITRATEDGFTNDTLFYTLGLINEAIHLIRLKIAEDIQRPTNKSELN